MSWWWLSFVNRSQPKGSRGMGAALVEAPTMRGAIQYAQEKLGAGHTWEVAALPWPEDEPLPPEKYRDRLMTRAEAQSMDDELSGRHLTPEEGAFVTDNIELLGGSIVRPGDDN